MKFLNKIFLSRATGISILVIFFGFICFLRSSVQERFNPPWWTQKFPKGSGDLGILIMIFGAVLLGIEHFIRNKKSKK
ncbi:MAG: hypothetical protein PHE43_03025 [Candidatus Nanoarchaeia archaeon]|nr:hypothetical protein [Candidatus Nanoarchaeia archaeon]